MSQSQNIDENKAFLHAFNVLGFFSLSILKKVQENFKNNWKMAWEKNLDSMRLYIDRKVYDLFIKHKRDINIKEESAKLARLEIQTLYIEEGLYPKLLKQISDPPLLLYYKGNLSDEAKINLAVVGSRKMSPYGEQSISRIYSSFKDLPMIIVSGLAYGIDACAHREALKTNLSTIAVLGTGLDDESMYPSAHLSLAREIVRAGGVIISEYPPGVKGLSYNFPRRNRIIAGMSHGSLIIEADKKSGSLITAEFALDENRDVFAVPGSIFHNLSLGTNNLIKAGAKVVSSGEDIVNEYPLLRDCYLSQNNTEDLENLSEIEKKIYRSIKEEGSDFEEIQSLIKLTVQEINSGLALLEMKDKIKLLDNNFYIHTLTREKSHR
jgi:DNA processing protein